MTVRPEKQSTPAGGRCPTGVLGVSGQRYTDRLSVFLPSMAGASGYPIIVLTLGHESFPLPYGRGSDSTTAVLLGSEHPRGLKPAARNVGTGGQAASGTHLAPVR